MSASEDFQKRQELIPKSANFDLEEMSQICLLLGQRKKYAQYYLHNSDHSIADREATIGCIEQINKLIKQILGI